MMSTTSLLSLKYDNHAISQVRMPGLCCLRRISHMAGFIGILGLSTFPGNQPAELGYLESLPNVTTNG